MNLEFDSKPVLGDNDKYIKTKIKSYGDKGEYKFSRQKSKKKKLKKSISSLKYVTALFFVYLEYINIIDLIMYN